MTNKIKNNKTFAINIIIGYSILGILLLTIAFFNYLGLKNDQIGSSIFIVGIALFASSIVFVRKKKYKLAKLIVSITPSYFILFLSVYVKSNGVLDSYYFYLLPRMVVILSLMGPVIFFGINHLKTMIYTLLFITPPVLFFDEIHRYFGVHIETLIYDQSSYNLFKTILIVVYSIPLLSILLFQKTVIIYKLRLALQNNQLIKDKLEIEKLNFSLQFQANLYSVLRITSSTNSLNNILQQVLDELFKIESINIENKGLIFLTNEAGELELTAQRNCDILLNYCSTIEKGQCLCGKVLASKKKLFCNSVGHDHTISPEGMKPHGHYVVPINYENEVLGVINLYIKQGEKEEKRINEFLEAIADILAKKINSEKQKIILENKNSHISFQQNLLEVTHNELTASIDYAKSLQSSLLANQETLNTVFSDSSVLFLPKDRISGDFYFAYDFKDFLYFGIGDCTGHGISGGILAAMSMESVKTIIYNNVGIMPNELLENLRSLAKDRFAINKSTSKNDSMDAGFCMYDKLNDKLYFSGGFINLILIRNGQLIEYKADRCPIGEYPKNTPFSLIEVDFQKDDILYFTTDGYYDQFGHENDSHNSKAVKFKRSQFNQLILDTHRLTCHAQVEHLRDRIFEWSQKEEQTDDITVFILRHS